MASALKLAFPVLSVEAVPPATVPPATSAVMARPATATLFPSASCSWITGWVSSGTPDCPVDDG
jgi:hypothetical protein